MKNYLGLLLLVSVVLPLRGMEELGDAIEILLSGPQAPLGQFFEVIHLMRLHPAISENEFKILEGSGIIELVNTEANSEFPNTHRKYARQIQQMLNERVQRKQTQQVAPDHDIADEPVFDMDDL